MEVANVACPDLGTCGTREQVVGAQLPLWVCQHIPVAKEKMYWRTVSLGWEWVQAQLDPGV